eukprot:3656154-Rhodomonas_salina.2
MSRAAISRGGRAGGFGTHTQDSESDIGSDSIESATRRRRVPGYYPGTGTPGFSGCPDARVPGYYVTCRYRGPVPGNRKSIPPPFSLRSTP